MLPDAEKTRLLDGGKIESDFSYKTRFANLAVSPKGFSFNVLHSVKQTNYDLDTAGKRILPGRVMDRTVVQRHQFGYSDSTGKLVGNFEIIYNDYADAKLGMTANMILFMEGDKLVILRLPGGYSDLFAAGGKYKPGTASVRTEIVVKDGKVTRTAVSETFDVDPETLKMTPTGEKRTTVDFAEIGEGK